MQADHVGLKARQRLKSHCFSRFKVERFRVALVNPVGVGGEGTGPLLRNVIANEDHLGRGRSSRTNVVGGHLSVGNQRGQGREQQVTANRCF
jgi:hypothetical protein